ncbi:MAG: type II secretion system F family protein [Lachnospiraceae bacterium]|nr:type II secretion system F family protein [Lachnospiraceae bacterium]
MRALAEYALIMPAIGYLFYDKPAAGLIMTPYIPVYIRQRCRDFERRRKEKTAASFKDGMQIISTELSAGYSLENAFRESLGEIEMLYGQSSEIYKSFAEIAARININTNIEDAFADFAGKAKVEEIDSFAQVLTYAKRNGGNLVDIIRNTTDTISDKIEVKREINAITSSKRLEQNIMNLVPIGIILYMRLTSAEMFNKLYGNTIGIFIMTICLVIYFAARTLASRIADIKV